MTAYVRGDVAAGFGPVADAFAASVPADGPGGAFAAVVDGRVVVDVWAGTARDDGTPWLRDTAGVVFSGTKGVVAVAAVLLVQRGLLDLDAPVASVWPQFAAAGKEAVLVRDVLGHTAGLPGVAEPVRAEDLADPVRIEDALARQTPLLPVGTATYHALTYGWLVDGLVRHVTGRGVADVVATDVAGPLGLDLWIGVPDDVLPRVAQVRRAPGYAPTALAGPGEPHPLLRLVYGNPPLLDLDWSSRLVLQSPVPGANAVTTARSLARLYGSLVATDGVRLLDPATVALARRPLGVGVDPLSGRPLRFGAGFELAGTPSVLGPPADSFGHTGAGGSSHGAWPALRAGFSFVTAEMRLEADDDRSRSLLGALHDVVA